MKVTSLELAGALQLLMDAYLELDQASVLEDVADGDVIRDPRADGARLILAAFYEQHSPVPASPSSEPSSIEVERLQRLEDGWEEATDPLN